jgi:hypothetical protein
MTESEFTLNNLEYSNILPDSYTWNELKELEFSFDDGWRIPYRDELIKLFDCVEESRNGAILWSASAHANFSDFAWVVYFDDGGSNYGNRAYSYSMRLVRDINHENQG